MPAMVESGATGERKRSAAVVGAGNIGSHVLPLLARLPQVGSITIVDRDRYEAKNLASQDIEPRNVGRPKAVVQARRLRRINPALDVNAIVADLADVPLGALRAEVLLGCLDSRIARRDLCRRAWHLGIPYVDAGVEPGALLARVSTYVPVAETACIECLWDDRDYATLEQSYPCDTGAGASHATNAPAFLGALAASLQAAACQRLFERGGEEALGDHELVIDVAHHKTYSTALRRNPHCRFDHAVWNLEPLSLDVMLCELSERIGGASGGPVYLSSFRDAFVGSLTCVECGHITRFLQLANRVGPDERECRECGAAMRVRGFDLLDALDVAMLPKRYTKRSLRALGLRHGDVVTISAAGGEHRFELHGDISHRVHGRPRRESKGSGSPSPGVTALAPDSTAQDEQDSTTKGD